jgi:hypothetical protein
MYQMRIKYSKLQGRLEEIGDKSEIANQSNYQNKLHNR